MKFSVKPFSKGLQGSRGQSPRSPSADGETPCATLSAQVERGEKCNSISRRSEQDRSSLFTVIIKYTLKMFRWNIFNECFFASSLRVTRLVQSAGFLHFVLLSCYVSNSAYPVLLSSVRRLSWIDFALTGNILLCGIWSVLLDKIARYFRYMIAAQSSGTSRPRPYDRFFLRKKRRKKTFIACAPL